MYIVLCKLCNVHCTLYNVQSILYNVKCILYNVQCICTVYIQCTLYSVNYTISRDKLHIMVIVLARILWSLSYTYPLFSLSLSLYSLQSLSPSLSLSLSLVNLNYIITYLYLTLPLYYPTTANMSHEKEFKCYGIHILQHRVMLYVCVNDIYIYIS